MIVGHGKIGDIVGYCNIATFENKSQKLGKCFLI
jgi:hypothetical protein